MGGERGNPSLYPIVPGGNVSLGTGVRRHGFFEASSPRKTGCRYVPVDSSEVSYEMAQTLSNQSPGPYGSGCILVFHADNGLNSRHRALAQLVSQNEG